MSTSAVFLLISFSVATFVKAIIPPTFNEILDVDNVDRHQIIEIDTDLKSTFEQFQTESRWKRSVNTISYEKYNGKLIYILICLGGLLCCCQVFW